MHEAKIEQTETGLQPADDGWWILNASDIGWWTVERTGRWSSFESPNAPSSLLGIGIHILWPGDTPGYYHAEAAAFGSDPVDEQFHLLPPPRPTITPTPSPSPSGGPHAKN